MTTILIDKRIGLVITDSRVTEYENASFFGLRFKKRARHWVAAQKALYIHDRIFVGTGNVNGGLNVLLNALINKANPCNIKIDKSVSFHAFLVDKNWVVVFTCKNGIITKKLHMLGDMSRWAAGSGQEYLIDCFEFKNRDPHHALRVFSKVKHFDDATDDNINIFRI